MVQCIEVLEALIGLRHTCAQLLSESGITSGSLTEAEAAAVHATVKEGMQYRSTSQAAVQLQTNGQYRQCGSTGQGAVQLPDGSQYRQMSPRGAGLMETSRNGYTSPRGNCQVQGLAADFQQFGVSSPPAAGAMYTTGSNCDNQQHRSYQQQQQQGYSSGMSGRQPVYPNRCESAPPGEITHYISSSSSSMHQQSAAAAAAAERGAEGYAVEQRFTRSRSGIHQTQAQHSSTHSGAYGKQLAPSNYSEFARSSSIRSEMLPERSMGCYYRQSPSSKHGNSDMYGGRLSPESADEYSRQRDPGCSRPLAQQGSLYASRNIAPPSPIWR
jgi:hypothetical protein